MNVLEWLGILMIACIVFSAGVLEIAWRNGKRREREDLALQQRRNEDEARARAFEKDETTPYEPGMGA